MGVDLQVLTEVEVTTNSGDPIFTHIVEATDGMTAATRILEARVNGTPVTALCGHTWVPSRDPEKHPVCPKCVEIFEFARDLKGV